MLKKKCIRPSNHHSPPLCRFLSTTSSLPFSHTQNLVSFALVPFPFALPFSNTSLFKFKICSNVQMQLSGTELVEWGRGAAQTVYGFSQVTALSVHCLGLLLGPCTCQESGITVQANSNPPLPSNLLGSAPPCQLRLRICQVDLEHCDFVSMASDIFQQVPCPMFCCWPGWRLLADLTIPLPYSREGDVITRHYMK